MHRLFTKGRETALQPTPPRNVRGAKRPIHETNRHARRLRILACTVCLVLTASAQTPGSIATHSLPVFGASYIDPAGNVYTASNAGPVTPGAAQTQPGGGTCFINTFPVGSVPEACSDAHVTKIDSAGNTVFGTLLGGPTGDAATALAVDSVGNIFVTGSTGGSFPTTPNAANPTSAAGTTFAAKLSADGSQFLYSTYLPDTAATATAIGIDALGNAYVTGVTKTSHAYVVKISPDGSHFLYNMALGGSNKDAGAAIAVDAAGNVIVAGQTLSTDFPVTSGALQSQPTGQQDLFIAKLDPSGRPLFSTYLGGSGTETLNALQIDAAENIFVAGATSSLDFPTTASAFQPSPVVPLWNNSGPGGFIAKLAPDGASLVYSSFVPSADSGNLLTLGVSTLAVTASGEAFFAGATGAGFPVTASAPQACSAGFPDAFVTHLDPQGNLQDATYLGNLINVAQMLGVAADGSLYFVWHFGGNSTVSQIRFGVGSSAPPCLSPAVLNAATLVSALSPAFYPSSSLTPGELISLIGFGIGPDTGVGYPPGARQIPLSLGGVQVLFDKQPVPVLYAQSRQINAIAPADFGGRTLTGITVVYNGVTFGPVTAAVSPSAPGLFRLQPGISLQAFAMNQDGSMNSAANPAEPGSIVTLLGTGLAPSDPSCAPGSFSGSQSIPLALPAGFVFIGTQQVEYVGSAPYQPCGIAEIQMRVPNNARSGPTLIVPQSQQLVGATIFVK